VSKYLEVYVFHFILKTRTGMTILSNADYKGRYAGRTIVLSVYPPQMPAPQRRQCRQLGFCSSHSKRRNLQVLHPCLNFVLFLVFFTFAFSDILPLDHDEVGLRAATVAQTDMGKASNSILCTLIKWLRALERQMRLSCQSIVDVMECKNGCTLHLVKPAG